jgi:adenosylhomocysteine nucleosidase
MTTVVLCGMPEEKAVLRRALPDLLILSGTDKLNLPRLVPVNCTLIMSMGLCGGLAPGLSVNAVVVASSVRDEGDETDTPDPNVITNMLRSMTPLHVGPYFSSGLMDQSDTEKQRSALFKRYGAMAMDDETRYAVALARQRNISFGVMRAVSDDWRDTLPLAATGAVLNKDGSANIGYLLASLAKQPSQIPQLLTIARDFITSLEALEAAATACRSALTVPA